MRLASTAFVIPFLTIICASCAGPEVVPQTRIVEVPVHVPQPAACQRLRALPLPDGSTAQDVIEAQQAVILEYERQVIECAR